MSKAAFDKIREGLEEALEVSRRVDIPFEVQMNAERLYDEGGNKSVPTIIAEAIMAERERCAIVAEYAAQCCLVHETDGSGYYACEGVARDIRTPVQPPPQPVADDSDDLPF